MRRREFLGQTIAGIAGLSAAKATSAASPRRSSTARPVTIKFLPFWLMDDFAKKLANEFMSQNPHINIVFPPKPSADGFSNPAWDRALRDAYLAGDPYDMTITASFYSKWATQRGYTIDPTPLFLRDFGPNYQSLLLGTVSKWQEKMVGVPFKTGTELFYYNQDIIEGSGLPLPHEGWTWNDLFKIGSRCKKESADGQLVQWGCSVFEAGLFRDYIFQEGESLFTPDYRKATIDTRTGRAAANAVHDLIFKYHATGTNAQWRSATEDIATSWNHKAFYEGKVALLLDGDLRVKQTYEQAAKHGFHVGVAPPLRRKQAAVTSSPTIFQIWKSGNPDRVDAAWEFAKYWLKPKNQARMLAETGSMPILRDAFNETEAQDCLKKWPGLAVFQKAYDHATAGISDLPTMELEYQGMRPFIYRMILGKIKPTEAVKGMQEKCQAILDEFWSKADKGTFDIYEQFHK